MSRAPGPSTPYGGGSKVPKRHHASLFNTAELKKLIRFERLTNTICIGKLCYTPKMMHEERLLLAGGLAIASALTLTTRAISGKPEAAHRALDYTLRAFASGDEINGYGQEETVLLRWPEASLETFPDGSQRKPQWL